MSPWSMSPWSMPAWSMCWWWEWSIVSWLIEESRIEMFGSGYRSRRDERWRWILAWSDLGSGFMRTWWSSKPRMYVSTRNTVAGGCTSWGSSRSRPASEYRWWGPLLLRDSLLSQRALPPPISGPPRLRSPPLKARVRSDNGNYYPAETCSYQRLFWQVQFICSPLTLREENDLIPHATLPRVPSGKPAIRDVRILVGAVGLLTYRVPPPAIVCELHHYGVRCLG